MTQNRLAKTFIFASEHKIGRNPKWLRHICCIYPAICVRPFQFLDKTQTVYLAHKRHLVNHVFIAFTIFAAFTIFKITNENLLLAHFLIAEEWPTG